MNHNGENRVKPAKWQAPSGVIEDWEKAIIARDIRDLERLFAELGAALNLADYLKPKTKEEVEAMSAADRIWHDCLESRVANLYFGSQGYARNREAALVGVSKTEVLDAAQARLRQLRSVVPGAGIEPA